MRLEEIAVTDDLAVVAEEATDRHRPGRAAQPGRRRPDGPHPGRSSGQRPSVSLDSVLASLQREWQPAFEHGPAQRPRPAASGACGSGRPRSRSRRSSRRSSRTPWPMAAGPSRSPPAGPGPSVVVEVDRPGRRGRARRSPRTSSSVRCHRPGPRPRPHPRARPRRGQRGSARARQRPAGGLRPLPVRGGGLGPVEAAARHTANAVSPAAGARTRARSAPRRRRTAGTPRTGRGCRARCPTTEARLSASRLVKPRP